MSFEDESINFCLPANDIVLKFLQMKQSEQIKSIGLGMQFINVGTKIIQGWDNEEWCGRLKKEKERSDSLLSSCKEDLQKMQAKNQLLQNTQRRELIELSSKIKEQTHICFQNEIADLRKQLERKDIKISTLNGENRNAFKEAYSIFDKKASLREISWEAKIKSLRSEYEERLAQEKKDKESLIAQTQNSTIIGQIGENFTLCELNRRFPKAEIEDTHKQAGRGDFIFKETDFTMLIETKNYKNNVTKPEIEKFYRDIDTNHDIKCGILISLKSGICSREDFHLEVRDKKPILFLHNISSNMENLSLAVILFKLILGTNSIDLSRKEIEEKLKNSIPIIKRNWNKMRQQIKKFEQEMIICVADQESHVRSIFELLELIY
jgi:hypothetical protein